MAIHDAGDALSTEQYGLSVDVMYKYKLRMSGLLPHLEQHSNTLLGDPLCIYGDPACPFRRHLQKPYQDLNLTRQQLEFNRSMSAVLE